MIMEKNKSLILVFTSFIFYFIFAFNLNVKAAEINNVLDYGVIRNDNIEDTNFIQNAIDNQSSKGGGTVYFPQGEYVIDAIKSIIIKDNITLEFEKGAILKVLPNSAERYEVIEIHGVNNVKILGHLEIQGERTKHVGTTGEWGFGISVKSSKNVYIENPKISNCWGDGIYIGSLNETVFNENIKIVNPKLDMNRRQGISIISVKNLEIINPVITNTSGTPPQSGIDIEPNFKWERLENIKITNLYTEFNKGFGLQIYLKNLNGSIYDVSIYVDKSTNIKDGIYIDALKGVKGEIKVGEKYYMSFYPDLNSTHWAHEEIKYLANRGIVSGYPNGQFQPEKFTSRAEAAKMLAASLNLPKQNYNSQYLDISESHWAKDAIAAVTNAGLFDGYPNGTFQPEKNITRAEMAKILVKAYNYKGENTNSFIDVPTSHWASTHISILYQNNIIIGFPNKTFQPNSSTTRAQYSVFLSRVLNNEFR